MSPAELDFLDPQQRMSLEVTWEALEDAGINPDSLKDTNAEVYFGVWKFDYYEIMTETLYRKNEFIRSYMGKSNFFNLNLFIKIDLN